MNLPIKLRIENLSSCPLWRPRKTLLKMHWLITTGVHRLIKLRMVWHRRVVELRIREIKRLGRVFIVFGGFLGFGVAGVGLKAIGIRGIRIFTSFSRDSVNRILTKSWVKFEIIFRVDRTILLVYFRRIRIFYLFFLHIL